MAAAVRRQRETETERAREERIRRKRGDRDRGGETFSGFQGGEKKMASG